MAPALDRKTEAIIGIVFLVGMILTFIVAIQTFEGTPTVLLIVLALVFLGVAIFFLSGGTGGSRAGNGDEGQSQQQSVVLGGAGGTPQVIQQSSGRVYVVCRSCGGRAPESARHCPECGKPMAG